VSTCSQAKQVCELVSFHSEPSVFLFMRRPTERRYSDMQRIGRLQSPIHTFPNNPSFVAALLPSAMKPPKRVIKPLKIDTCEKP
jgi:hypothetical protein